MKNITFLFVAFLLVSFQPEKVYHDHSLIEVPNDKEFLVKYFSSTAADLEEAVAGLSAEQMAFKPSDDAWSISQVLEHIIATEKMLFINTQDLMEQPENSEKRAEIKTTDEDLMAGIINRDQKFKAPEELQPQGIFKSPEEAIIAFESQRSEIMTYVKNNRGNMRNHISDSPFGAVDAHQSLLFIAGHTARHTEQIKEVKAHEDFPVK